MTAYTEALKAGREKGASKASDSEAMALFLHSSIQALCGAVSPELIWDGAMKAGLTFCEVGNLASSDPHAIADLMWL